MPDPFERPPIANAPLSIVLLSKNTDAPLEGALREWSAYLESLGREYEVLVVNVDSSDRTVEIAEGQAAQYPRIRVLRHPGGGGVGAAFRTALAAAQHPLLFYADGGPSYQPSDLALLLETIDKVDLVSGYRVWQTRRRPSRFNALAIRWVARLAFGVRLRDPDCSFKLFRRSIFARIPIQSDGPFVHTEILAKANFLGCLMAEVPVAFREDQKVPVRLRQRRTEAWRVFLHPDFGPAVLPEPAKELPA